MMEKKSIRCYKIYGNVYPGVYNHLVYLPLFEGWSSFTLNTCINCGEIFVIDWDNPVTMGMSIYDIADNQTCPVCSLLLRDTLKKYPNFIKLPDGKIGSYSSSDYPSIDTESIISKFFEIKPSKTL